MPGYIAGCAILTVMAAVSASIVGPGLVTACRVLLPRSSWVGRWWLVIWHVVVRLAVHIATRAACSGVHVLDLVRVDLGVRLRLIRHRALLSPSINARTVEQARPTVHFVGFRGDEYVRACRVWGEPDFVHLGWDRRARRELADGDTIVFAHGTADQPFAARNFNDIREGA